MLCQAGGAPGHRYLPTLRPLAAALLLLGAAVAPAQGAPGITLPDLGTPGSSTPSLKPTGNGVSLEVGLEQKKLVFTPEYSNQTGTGLSGAFAAMLSDGTALGLVGSIGGDKTEVLANAGFSFGERQRLLLSAGQMRQSLGFAFPSGFEKVGLSQTSAGASFQYQMGLGWLESLEANGYHARTGGRDLGAKNFTLDTAALYELWSDPRRIAGGTVSGVQGKATLMPLPGSQLNFSFGAERLVYGLATGQSGNTRATGGVEWRQRVGDGFQFLAGAERFASQARFSLGLERTIPGGDGRHNLGLSLVDIRGRDGVGDDRQVKLSYSYAFGGARGSVADAPGRTSSRQPDDGGRKSAPQAADLLDRVAQRPGWLPNHVVAKIDPTALPLRLISVTKTGLPAGSTVDLATGDVSAPLGLAVAGIAGITKNGAPFTNTGQFVLSGNSLLVKPNLITQPAVGTTDTYVVTLNNTGGGTTLATVTVARGSVRIESIVAAAGDVTAPVTTAAPSVSGTSGTGTTLSATLNEAGTGYYLVQLAGATAPTVAALLAANNAFAMAANSPASVNITGLTGNTAYKIYFVAKDAVNNVQAAVQSVDVTTVLTHDQLAQEFITRAWMDSGVNLTLVKSTTLQSGYIVVSSAYFGLEAVYIDGWTVGSNITNYMNAQTWYGLIPMGGGQYRDAFNTIY